jgi:hypothetical protein
MSRSASEIEREVEASRANVENTIEALKDKMSLGQIVDEAARYFKDSGGSHMVSNLGSQVRDNPLPLALVGIGLAWLMSGRGQPHLRGAGGGNGFRPRFGFSGSHFEGAPHPDYSRWARQDEDWEGRSTNGGRLTDAASNAAESVSSGVHRVASGVGSALASAGEAVTSAGSSVASGASRAASAAWSGGAHAQDAASHYGAGMYDEAARYGGAARRRASDLFEAEPLVLGALGLAVGAAIGAMLPRTSVEDRFLGETGDRVRDSAAEMARERFEQARSVAAEAGRTAMDEAEKQGLTPDSLKERASEVARATVDKVRESTTDETKAKEIRT